MSSIAVIQKVTMWEHYQGGSHGLDQSIDPVSLKKLKESHGCHKRSLETVIKALEQLVIKHTVSAVNGPPTFSNFRGWGDDQLVLTVGGDGTFLAVSHGVGSVIPVMPINSDPTRSHGHFCLKLPTVDSVKKAVHKALHRPKITKVSRMSVRVDDKLVANRVLNEALFSHACPAAMTRVEYEGTRYSCSGLWVGTGAGSTGAIRSAGGDVHSLGWKKLQMIVREAFCSKTCKFSGGAFEFQSKTTDGALFLDGQFHCVPVKFDQTMEFRVSDEPLSLIRA